MVKLGELTENQFITLKTGTKRKKLSVYLVFPIPLGNHIVGELLYIFELANEDRLIGYHHFAVPVDLSIEC